MIVKKELGDDKFDLSLTRRSRMESVVGFEIRKRVQFYGMKILQQQCLSWYWVQSFKLW